MLNLLLEDSLRIRMNESISKLMGYATVYMLDSQFQEKRENGELLTIGNKRVLVEMGFMAESPILQNEIFQLKLKGFTPILAHPERYSYLAGNLEYIQRLVDMGCELQLNLLSLTDHYGKATQKTAMLFLNNGLYSWAGTDTHHLGHIDLLNHLSSARIMKEIKTYPFKNIQLL